MKKFITILFLTFPVIGMTASFDCNKASNEIEKAICSDSNLSSADETLSSLYKINLENHPDLKASQIQWIQETRKCETSSEMLDCIKTAYQERIEYLNSLNSEAPSTETGLNEAVEEKTSEYEPNNEVATDAKKSLEAVNLQQNTEPEIEESDSEDAAIKITESTILIFLAIVAALVYFFRKRSSKKPEVDANTSLASSTGKSTQTTNLPEENVESLFSKGVFLYENKEFEKAFDYLENAANKGNAASQFYLGKILTKDAESINSPNFKKGLEWIKKAADNGYQDAKNEIEMYETNQSQSAPEASRNKFNNKKSSQDDTLNEDSEMTFDAWKRVIKSIHGADIATAAAVMGLTIGEVEQWRKREFVPNIAIKFLEEYQPESVRSEVISAGANSSLDVQLNEWQHEMTEVLEAIENKILERGLLNSAIGTNDYELSITTFKGDGVIDVNIEISTDDDDAAISENNTESISDYVSEKIQDWNDDCANYVSYNLYLNGKKLNYETYGGKNNERQKSMMRYIRQNVDGEFLYGVVYLVTEKHNGETLLNGAYYGYAGGGEYDGGYFQIDFVADSHNVLSFDEAESSDDYESLEPLMAECGSFYDNDDESYELSDYAKSLLANGVKEDDDVIFMDEDFDGDLLSEISEQWAISLRFES